MCGIDRLATQELRHNMNIVEGGKQAKTILGGAASRPNHPTNRTSRDSQRNRGRNQQRYYEVGPWCPTQCLAAYNQKRRNR